MSFNKSIIGDLLYEEESPTLDFKMEQYSFDGATDYQKSELLKDILAFANAWRRSDAFILIGVEERKGHKANVNGISNHLDDAQLQQFVNSKIQQPLQFSYNICPYDNVEIGVIYIPLQKRPFYLMKDYGKLQKNVVYLRRGSSTAEADPDEIIKMGFFHSGNPITPVALSIQFANTSKHLLLGKNTNIATKNYTLPSKDEIPDYRSGISMGHFEYDIGMGNRDYYREFAHYFQITNAVKPINFAIKNDGDITANDVNIEIRIEDEERRLFLFDEHHYPDRPQSSSIFKFENIINANKINPDIQIDYFGNHWLVRVVVRKAQPKSMVFTESCLYLGAKQKTTVNLKATIYADNVTPREEELEVTLVPSENNISLDVILKVATGMIGKC